MVRDTGSPPFVVGGNLSIGRESTPVKGPFRTKHARNQGGFEGRCMAVEAAAMA